MRIDIATYDCGIPCESGSNPEGEGVTFSQNLSYFRTGPQLQPNLPKVLESSPYRISCDNISDICYRLGIRQLSDTRSTFHIFYCIICLKGMTTCYSGTYFFLLRKPGGSMSMVHNI